MDLNGRCQGARDHELWKGAISGLAGGLVGAWVMNQFQAAISKLSADRDNGSRPEQEGDDATEKAASAMSESIAGHRLTDAEKQVAGPVVHYVFGSTMGAVYGALAEVTPSASGAQGLPFGAMLWLGADELAVPAVGLGSRPEEVPASTHASALAAHLVFGATTETVRRIVRRALQ